MFEHKCQFKQTLNDFRNYCLSKFLVMTEQVFICLPCVHIYFSPSNPGDRKNFSCTSFHQSKKEQRNWWIWLDDHQKKSIYIWKKILIIRKLFNTLNSFKRKPKNRKIFKMYLLENKYFLKGNISNNLKTIKGTKSRSLYFSSHFLFSWKSMLPHLK